MDNQQKQLIEDIITLSIVSSNKIKNLEVISKVNQLLDLNNYDLRKSLIEWKRDLEASNSSQSYIQMELQQRIDLIKSEVV